MAVKMDKSTHVLGKPCPNGHIYEDSGKTLRYKKGKQRCVECNVASVAKKQKPEEVSPDGASWGRKVETIPIGQILARDEGSPQG